MIDALVIFVVPTTGLDESEVRECILAVTTMATPITPSAVAPTATRALCRIGFTAISSVS
jgi:hypothetical protein